MTQQDPQPDQKSKIVVDEDWKKQAEQEKKAPAEAGAAGQTARALPPASFATLVSSLVTQVLFALGAVQDRRTGRRFRDLELAKHHVDTLTMLEQKTKGNLTDEEKHLLDNALYEVRMAYVQVVQQGQGQ